MIHLIFDCQLSITPNTILYIVLEEIYRYIIVKIELRKNFLKLNIVHFF